MADKLEVLLEEFVDPGLHVRLTAVDKVLSKRTFGLVLNSHMSEQVGPIDSSAC